MKCATQNCNNEVPHRACFCVDCINEHRTSGTLHPVLRCDNKNCNEPRLRISRFCNKHYDEARAAATGEGYDGVPNITVFAETPEELSASLARYRSMGYVEIGNHLGRRVGEGVEMRYVRQSTADEQLQADILQLTKRCDRNDFTTAQRLQGAVREGVSGLLAHAAPRREGKMLELSYDEHHRLVWLILSVTEVGSPTVYNDVRDILKSYGIIGGAQ